MPSASKKFQITFVGQKTVQADLAARGAVTGKPGSILDIALKNGVDIEHACGGVCACSTCHVHVTQGLNTCSPAEDSEQDMLDLAPDLKPSSRLACQCVPSGEANLIVEIPKWNRNMAREGR